MAGLLAASILLPAACGEGVVELPTPVATSSPTAALKPTPVAAADTPLPVEPLPLAPVALEPAFPGLEFDRMVLLTYPDDGSGRLFVVLQPGRIVVFENDPGVDSTRTFLDIRER